jgi:hypothetical protein
MGWTIPGRRKAFRADNYRQEQGILDGQFLAGTRYTGLTITGRDERFSSF